MSLTIKNMAKIASNRVRLDKDLTIAVTGFEGDGKSALALGIGMETDPLFDLRRNVLFSPTVEETKEKIYSLPKFSPLIADEAIKIMYKLNWSGKLSKYLNTIYGLCRKENKISILCMPRITDFTEYFRNHRIRIWIHIIDPINNQKRYGHAILMTRSWNPITQDPWGLKSFERNMEKERRRRRMDSEYSLDDKIDMFSRLPTFIDVIKFGWLDDKIWDEYLRLKNEVTVGDDYLIDDQTKELEKWKSRTLYSVKAFMLLGFTKKSIAKLYKISEHTISGWLSSEKRKLKKV